MPCAADAQMDPGQFRCRAVLHPSRVARPDPARSFRRAACGKVNSTTTVSSFTRLPNDLDYATLPFSEIYQLGAGLEFLQQVGVDRIEAHTAALAQALRAGLAALGYRMFTPGGNRSSIVIVLRVEGSRHHQRRVCARLHRRHRARTPRASASVAGPDSTHADDIAAVSGGRPPVGLGKNSAKITAT